MTAAGHRANIASILAARDRLDTGYEDERNRLQRELDSLTQRWENDRLELDSQWGDEVSALEAIEEHECGVERAAAAWNHVAGVGKWAALG